MDGEGTQGESDPEEAEDDDGGKEEQLHGGGALDGGGEEASEAGLYYGQRGRRELEDREDERPHE